MHENKNDAVCIAVRRVKVTGPRSRTKHFQPPNTVALADGGYARTMLGDGWVHRGRQLVAGLGAWRRGLLFTPVQKLLGTDMQYFPVFCDNHVRV